MAIIPYYHNYYKTIINVFKKSRVKNKRLHPHSNDVTVEYEQNLSKSDLIRKVKEIDLRLDKEMSRSK